MLIIFIVFVLGKIYIGWLLFLFEVILEVGILYLYINRVKVKLEDWGYYFGFVILE